MKLKKRLNEGSLDTRFLKAVSNVPSNEIHSFDKVKEILELVETRYLQPYASVCDWLCHGDCGAEEAFWVGMDSPDLGPNDYKEPIVYDDHGGFVMGIKNPKFTGKLLAKRLKDSGFDFWDEDEALDFIERYE